MKAKKSRAGLRRVLSIGLFSAGVLFLSSCWMDKGAARESKTINPKPSSLDQPLESPEPKKESLPDFSDISLAEASFGASVKEGASAKVPEAAQGDTSQDHEASLETAGESPEKSAPKEIPGQTIEIPDPQSPDQAPSLAPVAPEIIFHGERSRARVAITFDACEAEKPTGFDQGIWEVLVEKKVPATIFLGGKWMESHPEETRMIGENDLIEVGNHSYFHPDFRKISREKIQEEIKTTQDLQYRLTGKYAVVFRFPYGRYNKNSLEAVAEMGLYPVQWDVITGDPDRRVSAKAITRNVLKNVKNGSIIIFHINGRGWHTAEALPEIIDRLRQRGFELVTVSQLMGYSNPFAAEACIADEITPTGP